MRNIKRLLLVLIGIAIGVSAVIFVLTNRDPVALRFLYFESRPLWISAVVLAAFAAGLACGLGYAAWISLVYRRRLKAVHREFEELEEELIAFRNQPLEDADPLPGPGGYHETSG